MNEEQGPPYLLNLLNGSVAVQEEEDRENAACGIRTQQKLGDDIQKIERVLGGGLLPDDDSRRQLFAELRQIRESLETPSFLKKIADSYRKPLQDVSERLLLPKIKIVLRASQQMDVIFENNLKECLNALMSATNYYIKVLFKSFYNNSKIRVLFGSACTIIELQVAYSALCYILNNATFALTVGFIPDVRALSATFAAAYNGLTQVNVIAFLTSYGYTPEAAAAIYATIAAVSLEQGKFILKGIFLRGVNRFENKENPGAGGAAAAAQPPPPSFLQFITNPSSLFRMVKGVIPLPKLHLMIGEPGAAVSAVAVDKFQRFIGNVDGAVLEQLRTAFPDNADDVLVDILFKLLLGLDDEDYDDKDKFDIKLGFFIQKLKECIKGKYKEITDEDFHRLCGENLPGLNRGLTEDIISIIYGPHEPMSDSLDVQAGSQQRDPGEPSFKTKALEVFKTSSLRIWEHFTCFLGAIIPDESVASPRQQIEVSELEHPVLKLNNYIEELKKTNPELNKDDKLDRCFESFKRTIHIKTTSQGKVLYVTTEIPNPEKPNDFGGACKDLYLTAKNIGGEAEDTLNEFFEMCFTVGYIVCNISSDLVLPIPFGGNSVGASTAMADRYMNMLIEAHEKMIRQQQAAAAGEEVDTYDMSGLGGGKSRRKSRKNTKRTRRNKGRQSSKIAKKTQQRRSSRYRRSSRKGRK
jgi:hypothetical protein